MNKQEIMDLQDIVMDRTYRESIINKAQLETDSLEVKLCLKAMEQGTATFESRMVLQDFVCSLMKREQ